MRTLNICAALLFSIFTFNSSFAQTTVKKETIKVWGNCGMCKTTIEKAAKKGGATTAKWDEDSKELKVSYASNKTSSIKIQQAIAKSGYDTQDLTADNKAYDNLHGCCQYDRKGASAKTSCCDSEKCSKDEATCKEKQCCKEKDCCKS
jgi:periplasmic mercuric ion binding protein